MTICRFLFLALSYLSAGTVTAQQSGTTIAPTSDTAERVQARGFLTCGVSAGADGFSAATGGQYKGFDVDVCRGVAAAVLGDANKVKYVPVTPLTRFPSLQSGEIDILVQAVTWTFARDAGLGVDFTGVNFIDTQNFMVPKKSKITSLKQLNGATICLSPGSSAERNVADYFRANKMTFKPVLIERRAEVVGTYLSGKCDAWTTDRVILDITRTKAFLKPDEHLVLPEAMSKEIYSPVVRHGDNRWGDIVRWSVWAMIEAEEQGLTKANIDSAKKGTPVQQRLAGTNGDFGKLLGLRPTWSYDIIKQVGNYGESFDRNLKPIGIERGRNKLWKDGGLLYSPSFR
jgi:general L-amino acid transport system substrate-binding protein